MGNRESAEELLARMKAKYGAPAAGITAPPTQPVNQQPMPKPEQPKAPPPQGSGKGILGILGDRKNQIDKATGYANGGKIKGPGTPTSDSIPAKVRETGEPIKVSTGERIVSQAQEGILQGMAKQLGFDSLDQLLEAKTGKPVGPTIKGGVMAAATGKPPKDEWSLGKSPAPTIYGNGGLPADVVQSGIETMRNQMATPQPAAATGISAPTARPWYAGTDSRDARSGLEMERERRGQAEQAGVLGDPVKSAIQYGVVGKPQQAVNPMAASVNTSDIRAKNQAVMNGEQSAADPVALASLKAERSAAASTPIPGPQENQPVRALDTVPGGYIDNGAGILASRGANKMLNVTNVGTEQFTDPAKGVVDGSASALRDQQSGDPHWSPAAQLERMQQRRLMSDATDPSITDPRVRESAQKALGIIGNPAENKLKQAQAQGITAQTESSQMLADIQRKALAGDPQAAASYRALTGKGGENMRDNFMAVGGGQEYDQTANVMRNVPQRLIDLRTGQEVGGQAKPQSGGVKPSYEQFAAQMKQRHGDKATDEAMKQAYAKQFGA